MKRFPPIALLLLATLPATSHELVLPLSDRALLPVHFAGYGWSLAEARARKGFAWMQRMEADVAFDWPEAENIRLSVRAAPFFQTARQQVAGVFLNGIFVGQYVFPEDPSFRDFAVDLPATAVRAGANTLTFRVGYLARPANRQQDNRKLGLKVSRLALHSFPSQPTP